jgi:hypothetical protein
MKTFRLVTILLVALLSMSALPAAAAAPTNTSAGGAAYIDNQTHSIAPDSSLWYRFDYAVRLSTILITLPNGAVSGLALSVVTPPEAVTWWTPPPVGRGTPKGNDLTWAGAFNTLGIYYVQVVNNTTSGMSFQLTIQGSGVTLGPPATTAPLTPSGPISAPKPATTALVATTTGANTDPGHAAVIDNNSHAIPANSSLWYSFGYAGDHSQITITLLNGNNRGLAASVYTPAEADTWWTTPPVGRVTSYAINCTTGLPQEGGACQSNDLIWSGKFNANGTYSVRLVNNTGSTLGFQLTIQGTGVTLSP